MSTKAELACVYSALILADDDVAVTGEKIQTILKAANVEVEPYWPGLFAKALEGINIKDLITNVGSGVGAAPAGGAPVAAAAAADAAPAAKEAEKKKEEPEEESDDDMGFGKKIIKFLNNKYIYFTPIFI
ncbi:GSCOCG00008012001-RA-CDS [Cotesia congregata]|nr:GSCOCG00008012001-RA-CDS [Cotesia congregata]